jgi:hypothetical protein
MAETVVPGAVISMHISKALSAARMRDELFFVPTSTVTAVSAG